MIAAQWLPYIVPLLLTGLSSIALAIVLFQREDIPGARYLSYLLLAGAVWTLGYALEIISSSLTIKIFWDQIQFIGIVVLPGAFLAFTFQFTGKKVRWTLRKRILIAIVPTVTLLLVFTNEAHGLIWRQSSLVTIGAYTYLEQTTGLSQVFFLVYSAAIVIVANTLLMRMNYESLLLFRWQVVAIAISAMTPLLFFSLTLLEVIPLPYFESTGLALNLAVLISALSLSRIRRYEIQTVSRSKVIEFMRDAVLVLNDQNHIIDLNGAAESLLDRFAILWQEQPMEQAWPELYGQISHLSNDTAEITLTFEQEDQIYNGSRSIITDFSGRLVSQIIVLQDISRHRRQLLAVQAAGIAANSSLDLHQVLSTVSEEMARLLEVEACAISEWNRVDDTLDTIAEFGPEDWGEWEKMGEYSQEIFPLSDYPITRQVMVEKTEKQMTVNDPNIHPVEKAFMLEAKITTQFLVPLIFKNRVLGIVELMDSRMGRVFTNEEIALVKLLANQASVAIENARLFEESQRRLKDQIALQQASQVFSSTLDLPTILQSITKQICQAIDATSAYISNYDPERKLSTVLSEYYSLNASPEERLSDLGTSYNLTAELPQTLEFIEAGVPQIVHVDDPELDEDERELMQKYGCISALEIMLKFGGTYNTFVEIWESRTRHEFTSEEIALCLSIAQQASVAIENARLFNESQRRLKDQLALQQATQVFSSTLDVPTILNSITEQICLAIDATSAYISDYNPEKKSATVLAEYYSPSASPEERISDLGTNYNLDAEFPQTLEFLETGVPEIYHVDDPALNENERELMQKYGCKSSLEIILKFGGTYNTFEIWESRTRREFTSEEIALCLSIAQQASVAIENARLFDQAQKEIEERKRVEEQLRHAAYHDPLTQLPNRLFFVDRLKHAIELYKRSKDALFAVIFLDLDNFKNINDNLGHTAGDLFLVEIAGRLQTCFRTTDTVARFGGDEFVVLLENMENMENIYAPTVAAERIHKVMQVPFHYKDNELTSTFSMGIVLCTPEQTDPENYLRDADIAMYWAKSRGKARYEIFDNIMRKQILKRINLESDLKQTVDEKGFQLHYQPVVSLKTGRIKGFEALIRWPHPEHGMIPPGEFIPVAEEIGVIQPIGRWVLQRACKNLKHWQDQFDASPPLSVSVNLSGTQLAQENLVEFVQQTLDENKVNASSLIIEVTEGAIIKDVENAKVKFDQLRGLGVALHMDDFGIGYSSLRHLSQFPIDMIKIDRIFIQNMMCNPKDAQLIHALIRLSHELGIEVVAEGINNQDQLERLRKLDCDFGQGYLFAKPKGSESIQALLSEYLDKNKADIGLKPKIMNGNLKRQSL